MTRWEYLWLMADNGDEFIKYGSEGWELVAVWDGMGYFKRPLKDDGYTIIYQGKPCDNLASEDVRDVCHGCD